MKPFARHPSDTALTRWLDTGGTANVAEHVETCERCAERLEQLDRAGERPSFGDALASLLAAPVDLGERVLLGIERRSRTEQELTLLTGLFGLAVETGKLVVAPDEPAHRHPATTNSSEPPDNERHPE
ncbi:MAG TPA: hypothetical protein VNQ73_17815 [Ilumatobacter sp.]|nr:hypothetical protein [Ilumatobacter sp.]